MNAEKQNILISEALGLHKVSYEKKSWNPNAKMPEETVMVVTDKNGKKMRLWAEYTRASATDNNFVYPKHYAENLDDMHEAEQFFLKKDGVCYDYWQTLCDCVGVSPEGNVTWWAAFATAGQRAKAFLKMVNKWEE